MNAKFPISKIQMILTKDSREEVDNFFALFENIVDDVTVTQYNERGGNIDDLTEDQRMKIKTYLSKNNLPENTPYLVNFEDDIFIIKSFFIYKTNTMLSSPIMAAHSYSSIICYH